MGDFNVFYDENPFVAWLLILSLSCCIYCVMSHCFFLEHCTCLKRANNFDKENIFYKSQPKRIYAAHRGGAGERAENTLAAFKHAYNQGINFMELDLDISKDGKVVIFHDDDLGRLCGEQYKGIKCSAFNWE